MHWRALWLLWVWWGIWWLVWKILQMCWKIWWSRQVGCVQEDLYLGKGLDPVADLEVLLPLTVLREDLALKDSVLEGFSEMVLFLLLGQLLLLDQLF